MKQKSRNIYHGICRVCDKHITIRSKALYTAGAILHKDVPFFALSCNMLEDTSLHHSRLEVIRSWGKVDKQYEGYY